MRYSKSTQIKGSRKNSFRVSANEMCFGKATSYGFADVVTDDINVVYNDLLFSAVSPFIYNGGHRDKNSIVGVGDLIIIDIDSVHDILIELTACIRTMPFTAFTIPSQNYLLNGYKYRLLIPCTGIPDVEGYIAVVNWVVETFRIPSVDKASRSVARFFAPTIPIEGQVFDYFEAPPKDKEKAKEVYKVTATDVEIALTTKGLLKDGQLTIDSQLFPYQFSNPLQFHTDMLLFAPKEDEVIVKTVCGTTLTEIYDDPSNSLNKNEFRRLKERGDVCIGDVSSALLGNQRVLCKCPTSHLHTDSADERYAWLLKTSGNRTRLYCGSNTCTSTYGEYRNIVLPEWEYFLHANNPDSTAQILRGIVASVTVSLVRLFAESICNMEGAKLDDWYEKEAFAKERIFSKLIDENCLYILCMMVNKASNSAVMIHNVNLAGSRETTVVLGKQNESLQSTWYGSLFKPDYTEFYQVSGDKGFSKGLVVKKIVEIVSTYTSFVTVINTASALEPTQLATNSLKISYASGCRSEYIVNNSFDEPTFQYRKMLLKEGVHSNPRYGEIVKAFVNHWKLPRGSVMLKGFEVNSIVDLLILFSMLNLYSNGVSNQRHTAFAITSASGSGKSAILTNFHKVGLSNSDTHVADLFGYDGLYPYSIEELTDRLWVTGDELSPKVMKNIRVSAFLGNLTRLDVTLNVKGLINQSFPAYAKVMWGSRAYEALLLGDQSYEIRNRLFTINYSDDLLDSEFIKLCDTDAGYLDKAVQYFICDRYFEWKALISKLAISDVTALFSEFKQVLKVKYSGILEEIEDENGDLALVTSLTDSETINLEALGFIMDYKSKLMGDIDYCTVYHPLKPNNLGGTDGYIGYLEEANIKDTSYLYIPTINTTRRGFGFAGWYQQICIKMFGEKRGYAIANKLDIGKFKRFLGEPAVKYSRDKVCKPILLNADTVAGNVSKFGTRGKTVDLYTIEDIIKKLEK